MNDLEKRIKELQEQIDLLPKGYISKKTINGKVKYYLQWQEDLKKKSKYINENDKIKLEIDINKRRALQEELKKLPKM